MNKKLIQIHKIIKILSGLPKKIICRHCFFFIGSMPINFGKKQVNFVNLKEYLIFEKSDGIRGLFILLKDKVYLIDRNFFPTDITYIIKPINKKLYLLKNTVFDGELSFNILKENYEFLVYDLICAYGDWRISTWDLNGRINMVIKLTRIFSSIADINILNLTLIKKDSYKINILQNLFDMIIENKFNFDHIYINFKRFDRLICNKNDGIIFTPIKTPYVSKFLPVIFKWKYKNGNSIDLWYKKKDESKFKEKKLLNNFNLLLKIGKNNKFKIKNSKNLNSKFLIRIYKTVRIEDGIVEHSLDKKNNNWCYIKNRIDKKNSNSVKLFINTLEIINECFFKNELIDMLFKKNVRKKRGKITKLSNL